MSGQINIKMTVSGPLPSQQAERVIDIMGESAELFAEKNRGYGDTAAHLGARGQYADIWRKVGKLKHTLWEGGEVVGESMEEMLMDLIGHAALTVDFLRQDAAAADEANRFDNSIAAAKIATPMDVKRSRSVHTPGERDEDRS